MNKESRPIDIEVQAPSPKPPPPNNPSHAIVTPEKTDDYGNDQSLDFKTTTTSSPAHAVISLLTKTNAAHIQTVSSLPDLFCLTQQLSKRITETINQQKQTPALSDKHLEALAKTLEKYEATKRQLKAKNDASRELQRSVKELELTVAQGDRAALELRDEHTGTKEELAAALKMISKIEGEQRTVTKQREAEEEWVSKLKYELSETQEALTEERKDRSAQQEHSQQILSDLKAKLAKTSEVIADQNRQTQRTQKNLAQFKLRCETVEKEKVDVIMSLSTKDKELTDAVNNLCEAKNDVSALTSECELLRGLLGEKKAEVESLEKELSHESSQVSAAVNCEATN